MSTSSSTSPALAPGRSSKAWRRRAKVATLVISDAGKESVSEASFGRRELTIKSANGHSYRSCERAIQMIASGEFPIGDLSVPPFGLNQASQAIAVAGKVDRAITFASIVPEVR